MECKRIRDGVWEFQQEGMNVPARVIASDKLYPTIEEGVFKQISNVARLPGVISPALVMPDGHFGYGFPIGGVAAFDMEEGVISPGGVGYDINCGVRLISTDITAEEIAPHIRPLTDDLFVRIPSGLGSKSKLSVTNSELDEVCLAGASWAVENGYGIPADLKRMEENGAIDGADPSKLSVRAKKRGRPQLGTLGSGNHFLEIGKVEKIYDDEAAKRFGLPKEGDITVMVHTGSRGMGYQVADENIGLMLSAAKKYGIDLPDDELACAPIKSREAADYVASMYCAVNYAFANRQFIMHWVRESFKVVFPDARMDLVYDVAHNIAKFEDHGGREVCVHRKGATRAFAAGRKEIPKELADIGQPVLVPGDMGTASYVLVGTEKAMQESFGSVCHGAGRILSRAKAKRTVSGADVKRDLEARGEYIRAASDQVLAEEFSGAYKDVDQVIDSVSVAGLARPVAKLVPLAVVKG